MVLNQIVEFLIADVGGDPSSMSDVMALIEKFSRDERMSVAFDEFQEVKKLDAGDQVLAMLRGKIQFPQDTCFVFSGSVRSDT